MRISRKPHSRLLGE
jgi:uncharacterized protein with GYD domain